MRYVTRKELWWVYYQLFFLGFDRNPAGSTRKWTVISEVFQYKTSNCNGQPVILKFLTKMTVNGALFFSAIRWYHWF